MKLKKSAVFTDIHWGARINSDQHNLDCYQFIQWFCANVRNDPEIDNIIFLGDWFDNRSSVNVATLHHAVHGARLLNELNLPIYFIVGNHDLYHRHTREIHSALPFAEFKNFHIIDHPQVVEEMGDGVFMTPYLFHHEYDDLYKYSKYRTWWGHFEFKGFIITGADIKMPTGPNSQDFSEPKFIFSGHFHKRQVHENVVYIGNAFPTNFNDADDHERGMMIYDHEKELVGFINWEECPKFQKTYLSNILDNEGILIPNSRVKCNLDIPISYEESDFLKRRFVKRRKLREFSFNESAEVKESIEETSVTIVDGELKGVNELVIEMIMQIELDEIDNPTLVKMYQELEE